MTDTITPASLRAHADWFDATFEPGSVEARSLRNCAARLEAESARDEEAERYAKVYRSARCDEHPILLPWSRLPAIDRKEEARVMRGFLDHLAADGRLLPEGGTGEADVKPIGWWRALELNFAAEHYGFPPLPRSSWIASDGSEWAWDERMQVWELRQYPPAVSVPDSGPDGTPEEPWPNLRAVPVPVREVRDRHGLRWERHSDTEWRGCDWSSACAAGHPEDAPFVRVDGDKA